MLTQTELKSQLHYDHDTGIFTRVVSNTNSIKVGDVAGCKHVLGYIHIKINGKEYKAHRLAWLYINGKLPIDFIDHINGVRCDNRIINLREATNQQNILNAGKKKNNTSGYKGVCFHSRDKKWGASALLNGKRKYLGNFTTPESASQAYQSFAKENHGEFYRG